MKRMIKDIIAWLVYHLYRIGIKKCPIKVYGVEETIQELQNTEKSMIRYGDGEMAIIRGRNILRQDITLELQENLKRILGYEHEEIIITIPDIFGDLSGYVGKSQMFHRDHLLFYRKIYEKYCNNHKKYHNTFITRFYYIFKNKNECGKWAEGIRNIWNGKDIVVVEGAVTHNGVGNDLLDKANSIERIIGPSTNAYMRLEEIYQACCKYPKDRLFLVSLGATAKLLCEKLFLTGYRALDIGNLDMEYEWYLKGIKNKQTIPKQKIVSEEDNKKAGFHEYLHQIAIRFD